MEFIYYFWGLFGVTAFCNKKNKKIALVSYIVFIVFYCLRKEVGTDWPTYFKYFYSLDNIAYVEGRGFEIGYWFINYIFSKMGFSYWNLVTFIGISVSLIFYISIKRYSDNYGIIFLLGLFYFFYPSYESIRASIAIVLFLYSIGFVEDNEKKYLLCNIFGMLFHYSSIIAFVYYLFYKFSTSRKLILILAGGMGVLISTPLFFRIVSILPDGIGNRIIFYLITNGANKDFIDVVSLKLIEYIILLIAVYFLFDQKEKLVLEYKRMLQLGIIIIIFLGMISNIGYRFTYYTDMAVIFTYSKIYDYFKSIKVKFLYVIILVIYTGVRLARII